MAGLLVELLNFELSQIAGFEFGARRTLAPTHVGTGDGSSVVSEANSRLVLATVDLGYQTHQITARRIIVSIPIRIFVAGQFLRSRYAAIRRSRNWPATNILIGIE